MESIGNGRSVGDPFRTGFQKGAEEIERHHLHEQSRRGHRPVRGGGVGSPVDRRIDRVAGSQRKEQSPEQQQEQKIVSSLHDDGVAGDEGAEHYPTREGRQTGPDPDYEGHCRTAGGEEQ